MKLYKYTEEELRKVVKTSFSIRHCLLKLGVAAYGGNYKVFKNAIEHFNIDTSHLELHHINKSSDNRLNNLQLLCPNCHALTDNYRGKAKKK